MYKSYFELPNSMKNVRISNIKHVSKDYYNYTYKKSSNQSKDKKIVSNGLNYFNYQQKEEKDYNSGKTKIIIS